MAKIVMPGTVLAVSAFKEAAPCVCTGVAAHRRRMVGMCRLMAFCVSGACYTVTRGENFWLLGSV